MHYILLELFNSLFMSLMLFSNVWLWNVFLQISKLYKSFENLLGVWFWVQIVHLTQYPWELTIRTLTRFSKPNLHHLTCIYVERLEDELGVEGVWVVLLEDELGVEGIWMFDCCTHELVQMKGSLISVVVVDGDGVGDGWWLWTVMVLAECNITFVK